MAKHRAPPLLVVTMLPLFQAHEMAGSMQERLRPKRRKRKAGGAVPGFCSGGRADRKPRQAGGAIVRGLGLIGGLADDVLLASAAHKAGRYGAKKVKEAFEDCDDDSDDPEEHCDEENAAGDEPNVRLQQAQKERRLCPWLQIGRPRRSL